MKRTRASIHTHTYIHNMLASVLSSHEIFHFPQLHRDRSCTYVYVTAGEVNGRGKNRRHVQFLSSSKWRTKSKNKRNCARIVPPSPPFPYLYSGNIDYTGYTCKSTKNFIRVFIKIQPSHFRLKLHVYADIVINRYTMRLR